MSVTEDLEVTHYVEAVRAALADLPVRQRDELLEDLPGHLAEVRAESGEPLERRLGPPEAYAADLCAAAGLTNKASLPLRARLDTAALAFRSRLPGIDRRVGRILGYEHATDFLRLLRPAWWVLRGYLVAMLFAAAVSGGVIGLLPRVGGSDTVALILLSLAVIGSIWLGRREADMRRERRLVLTVASVIGGLLALVMLAVIDGRATGVYNGDFGGSTVGYYDPGPSVDDVYVYDRDGHLLTDVRLYDQAGRPIELGYDHCPVEAVPGSGVIADKPAGIYPYCPGKAPFSVPVFPSGELPPSEEAQVTPTPEVSVSPQETPNPTPSPTDGASPEPSAS